MFVPLINKTHFSLLAALPSAQELVKRAKDYGYSTLALCDDNAVYAVPQFVKLCREKYIGCLSALFITFRAVMRLTQHLTVLNTRSPALTPRCYMVGIHSVKFPHLCFVRVITYRTQRAI